MMARSSTRWETNGKRSETSIPDWPYFLNVRFDPRTTVSRSFPFWKSSLPKLSGGCWPLSLASSGLGSNVSTWLGPPCMNREITLFAVAGSGGVLAASGPAVPAAAVRWNKSRAASQPMPRPDVCRNLRRDSSIDINKLAHIEDQEAQPGQGIAPQIIERHLAFFGGRKASERHPPPGLHRSFRAIAGQFRNSGSELIGLLRGGLAVHQRQRLRRHGRTFAAGTARGRIRRIEDLQHRQCHGPFHLEIDAAPVMLGRVGIGGP